MSTITATDGWEINDNQAIVHAVYEGAGTASLAAVKHAWESWLTLNVESGGYFEGEYYQHKLSGADYARDPDKNMGGVNCREISRTDSYDHWELEATYDAIKVGINEEQTNRRIGDVEYSGGSTGATKNIKFALAVRQSAGATVSAAEKLVGWTGPGDDQSVEGVEVPVPGHKLMHRYWVPASNVTPAFVRSVDIHRGEINDSAWRGYQKGEVMFEGMEHRVVYDADGEEAAELTYHFNCIPNVSGLEITGWDPNNPGATTTFVIDKRGWEYVSTPTRTGEVSGIKIALPDSVYVQQLAEYTDFDDLYPRYIS
jgi:hypothetical protein